MVLGVRLPGLVLWPPLDSTSCSYLISYLLQSLAILLVSLLSIDAP